MSRQTDLQYTVVTDAGPFRAVLESLQAADSLAFDTEFVAEDCYEPDLCLIQIATREQVFLIDPKQQLDIKPLWEILVRPDKRIIVHAGREEILFVYRATGQIIPNLFDVQMAAGFLGGEYPAALGKLLQRQLGILTPKGETRTQWRTRPLTKAQLDYAALDVRYLHELYDVLSGQLQRLGRLNWLHEELQERQRRLINAEQEESWMRISGVQTLNRQQLGIVRELWRWRDERARSKNLPPRRVLRDDLIIELARRGATQPKRIAHVRGLHHSGFKRFLPELAECIQRGAQSEIPVHLPSSKKIKRVRHSNLLQQFLSAAMAYLCRKHNIAPAIVGSSDDIGRLINYWLEGEDIPESDPQYPRLLTGWRRKLIAEPLERIFRGQQALRVADPLAEMPLELCDIGSEIVAEKRESSAQGPLTDALEETTERPKKSS